MADVSSQAKGFKSLRRTLKSMQEKPSTSDDSLISKHSSFAAIDEDQSQPDKDEPDLPVPEDPVPPVPRSTLLAFRGLASKFKAKEASYAARIRIAAGLIYARLVREVCERTVPLKTQVDVARERFATATAVLLGYAAQVSSVAGRAGLAAQAGKAVAAAGAVAKETALNETVQSTALGAVAGAATMSTSFAAVGTVSGAALGAVIGVVPAFFTFGLSIPLGAVIGGSAVGTLGFAVGLAGGSVTGATVGAAYAQRNQIMQASRV